MNPRQFKILLVRNGIPKGLFFALGALSLFMIALGFRNLKTDENTAWMWFTFSIFSVIFTAVFAMISYGLERGFNKEDKDYTEAEFTKAALILENADRKQPTIFGEEFLISTTQRAVIRYKDILWAYILQPYLNGVKMGRMLEVRTRKRNVFKLAPANNDDLEELEEMMELINDKNPSLLIGHADENRRIYDSMTK
ncbi:MAG: hypothetical protein E7188_03885 [Erysipelotrichaceae bacterium]|nr:hypothetical protein [Erysipelotrichaceae bacterium]